MRSIPEGLRPLLYLVAPYVTATTRERGDRWQAMKQALALGWAPVFAPSVYASVLADSQKTERDVAIDCALAILRKSDAVLVLSDRITPGMRRELDWLDQDDKLADALAGGSVGKSYKKRRYTMDTLAAPCEEDQ